MTFVFRLPFVHRCSAGTALLRLSHLFQISLPCVQATELPGLVSASVNRIEMAMFSVRMIGQDEALNTVPWPS